MVYSAYTVGMEFTSIPTDKWEWHPSPLPSQITLVTSRGADGALDFAPKSCLAVMAFDPLTVGFACNRGHTTYQNIVRTGEFVVNVLPEGLAPLAWAIIAFQGQERIDASGLTFLESKRVAVPRIAECTAHLECEFDDAVAFESGEAFVYGRVLAADILSEAVGAGERGYRLLDPCFYLDGGWAGMGAAKRPEA